MLKPKFEKGRIKCFFWLKNESATKASLCNVKDLSLSKMRAKSKLSVEFW